jgi:hypothetical protein
MTVCDICKHLYDGINDVCPDCKDEMLAFSEEEDNLVEQLMDIADQLMNDLQDEKVERDSYRAMLEDWISYERESISKYGPYDSSGELAPLIERAMKLLGIDEVKP